jgi:hypothetical protein
MEKKYGYQGDPAQTNYHDTISYTPHPLHPSIDIYPSNSYNDAQSLPYLMIIPLRTNLRRLPLDNNYSTSCLCILTPLTITRLEDERHIATLLADTFLYFCKAVFIPHQPSR